MQTARRPRLTRTTRSQPAVLVADDRTSVQLQLVESSGYNWPTETHDLEQRCSDAPPARLAVLAAPGAAAAKLAAWIERRALATCSTSGHLPRAD